VDSRFNSSSCATGRLTWRTVCAALAYLSYKRFVQVKSLVVENAIRTGFTSSDGHSVHAHNNIASQFAANPSVVEALGFPITAEFLTMIHL
jgi:hypothetical protein